MDHKPNVISCRFSNYSEIVWPVTFESINITTDFVIDNNRIQFPNSLLASIRPVSPQYTVWFQEIMDNGMRTSFTLTKPQDRLLTFGIFGRDFNRDGELNPPAGNKSAELEHFSTILFVSVTFLLVKYFDGTI